MGKYILLTLDMEEWPTCHVTCVILLKGHTYSGVDDNGQWDQPYPTCQSNQYCSFSHLLLTYVSGKICPELTPPKNGRIFQDLNQGRKCNDVAFFECNHGYTRDGPLASTCLPSGQWSHPTPFCQCNSK